MEKWIDILIINSHSDSERNRKCVAPKFYNCRSWVTFQTFILGVFNQPQLGFFASSRTGAGSL